MRNFSLKQALTPTTRSLLITLLLIALALGVLNALTRSPGTPPLLARVFNLDAEFTFGAMLTGALFLSTGLTAFINGRLVTQESHWRRGFWLALALLFVYLALDEYFSIHEGLLAPTPGGSGPWVIIYAIGGALLLVATLVIYRYAYRDETNLFILTLSGFGVMGFAGLGLEAVNFFVFCDANPLHHFVKRLVNQSLCHRFPYIEEAIEMMGIAIVLAAFLTYAQTRLDPSRWRRAWRIVAALATLWVAVLVADIFVRPSLEARVTAQPASVSYVGGDLSLVGYRLSNQVAGPGDTVSLKLYWKAPRKVGTDYFVSAHVISRADAQSEAQTDRPLGGWLGWRSSTWLPGITMRDAMQITLPEDLASPESYWVVLRVWEPTEYHSDGTVVIETAEQILVEDADRQILEADSLILTSFPVLTPGERTLEPPITASYQFEDGITLSGYALPQSAELGATLPVEFWWTTQSDLDLELIQFVHLFHTEGDEFIVFDQPPFGGAFPTSDWPARMQVTDTLNVPLPEDMPSGEYRIHTGFYVLDSGERRFVTDGNGLPVMDNSIYLGNVTLKPPG